jgi:hypothetical protein
MSSIHRLVHVPWGSQSLQEIHGALVKLGLVIIDTDVVAVLDDGTLEVWWLGPACGSVLLKAS